MDPAGLIAFVNGHGDGVVSTVGDAGEPQSAYLALVALDDGSLVFDAKSASRKVQNIKRDPRIAITVGSGEGSSLQCEGLADVPSGVTRDECIAAYLDRFPEFEESIASDLITVVRVRLTWARFGEYIGDEFVQSDVAIIG